MIPENDKTKSRIMYYFSVIGFISIVCSYILNYYIAGFTMMGSALMIAGLFDSQYNNWKFKSDTYFKAVVGYSIVLLIYSMFFLYMIIPSILIALIYVMLIYLSKNKPEIIEIHEPKINENIYI